MTRRLPTRKPLAALCGAFLTLLLAPAATAGDWPEWRGPTRAGHTDEADLPLTWGGKGADNVLWKAAADFGHSSPVVRGERVFLTASVRRDPKGKENLAANQTHRVVCYRTTDGTKLWQTDVEPGAWDTEFSFTASTPATDDRRLYALFGSGVVAAVDLDGKLVWRKALPGGPPKAEWLSSSPILSGDTLFVFCDVSSDHWLLALDRNTGDVRWDRKRKQGDRDHNSSPLLLTVKDKPQIVVACNKAVMGLDPASDRVIWTCNWGGNRYPALVSGPGLVFVTGDGGDSLAIDPTGEGDVSKTHVRWRLSKAGQGFSTPVVVGDYLYRACQPGVIKCWKWADGELAFEERVEGAPTYPSPVATKDGRIYFASAGKSVVIKAGPKLEVLASNALEESRGEWTQNGPSPAVSGGRLFLRSPKALYCVGKK
jgi:outer membrane protein assembly factor BamB